MRKTPKRKFVSTKMCAKGITQPPRPRLDHRPRRQRDQGKMPASRPGHPEVPLDRRDTHRVRTHRAEVVSENIGVGRSHYEAIVAIRNSLPTFTGPLSSRPRLVREAPKQQTSPPTPKRVSGWSLAKTVRSVRSVGISLISSCRFPSDKFHCNAAVGVAIIRRGRRCGWILSKRCGMSKRLGRRPP